MAGPEDPVLAGGPVLAGNPVTDPMVAGVGRNAFLAAIAPPGATQADRAVEPMGIGPTPLQFNFLGVASSSVKLEILDGC